MILKDDLANLQRIRTSLGKKATGAPTPSYAAYHAAAYAVDALIAEALGCRRDSHSSRQEVNYWIKAGVETAQERFDSQESAR